MMYNNLPVLGPPFEPSGSRYISRMLLITDPETEGKPNFKPAANRVLNRGVFLILCDLSEILLYTHSI